MCENSSRVKVDQKLTFAAWFIFKSLSFLEHLQINKSHHYNKISEVRMIFPNDLKVLETNTFISHITRIYKN